MGRDIAEEIKERLTTNAVVLFMKGTRHMPQCGFSATAVAILNDLAVPYADVNVLVDPELRDGIKKYSDWPTVPQLYVGGEFVGGCDIMRDMHDSGELEGLMKNVLQATPTV